MPVVYLPRNVSFAWKVHAIVLIHDEYFVREQRPLSVVVSPLEFESISIYFVVYYYTGTVAFALFKVSNN